MMRATFKAGLALAVSACGGGEGTIPDQFHGVWDAEGSDCENFTDSMVEIGADKLVFHDGSGAVSAVRSDGRAVIVDVALNRYGEENYERFSVRYSLMTTPLGVRLKMSNPEMPKGLHDGFVLQRCS